MSVALFIQYCFSSKNCVERELVYGWEAMAAVTLRVCLICQRSSWNSTDSISKEIPKLGMIVLALLLEMAEMQC